MPLPVTPILIQDVPHFTRVEMLKDAFNMIADGMAPDIQHVEIFIHLEVPVTDVTEREIPMGMAGLYQPPL
jgi:hypothetical protein